MKKEKGQITLIMVIASMAVIGIIMSTTGSTTSATRTLSVLKTARTNYEEALFVNDYICGKFQEYVSQGNRPEKIFNDNDYYENMIKNYFSEAIDIINNECGLQAKDIQAPGTIEVKSYNGVSGYYQHWHYRVYNYSKVVRYKYNFKIDGKYRNIILEIGIVEVKKSNLKNYVLSYSTSFIYNAGGV
jgi:hypothetical protein